MAKKFTHIFLAHFFWKNTKKIKPDILCSSLPLEQRSIGFVFLFHVRHLFQVHKIKFASQKRRVIFFSCLSSKKTHAKTHKRLDCTLEIKPTTKNLGFPIQLNNFQLIT